MFIITMETTSLILFPAKTDINGLHLIYLLFTNHQLKLI